MLVIDDEPAIREIFAEFLTETGHEVVVAESGEEGLSHLSKGHFDVVLTDLGMPGLSGWEVAREVKKRSPDTAVILISGWGLDEDASTDRGLVDTVLAKPVGLDLLLETVTTHVSARAERANLSA